VLLDVRFLIECVTSPVWAWTARAVTGRASWPLCSCTMTVEVPDATDEFGEFVVLSLEKPSVGVDILEDC